MKQVTDASTPRYIDTGIPYRQPLYLTCVSINTGTTSRTHTTYVLSNLVVQSNGLLEILLSLLHPDGPGIKMYIRMIYIRFDATKDMDSSHFR